MIRTLEVLAYDLPLPQTVSAAIELWDPITTRPVSAGLRVTVKLGAQDITPIVVASGRFVALGPADAWPSELSMAPGKQPYEAIVRRDLTALQPPQWPNVPPSERLIRIPLKPTTSYVLADGVTAVSGYVYEANAADPSKRDAIVGATVWFDWYDTAGSPQSIDPSLRVTSDANGQFGVFARVPRVMTQLPDLDKGLLKIRLAVRRNGVTMYTPATFHFLPADAAAGRIPEGIALTEWVSLDWATLV